MLACYTAIGDLTHLHIDMCIYCACTYYIGYIPMDVFLTPSEI